MSFVCLAFLRRFGIAAFCFDSLRFDASEKLQSDRKRDLIFNAICIAFELGAGLDGTVPSYLLVEPDWDWMPH